MTSSVLKKTAIWVLDNINAAEIKLNLFSQDLILMYHSVESAQSGFRHSVAKEQFEAHIEFLINHFKIVSLDDLFDPNWQGIPRVALTFDDAFEDFYTNVYPLLKTRGIPATVFVPTRFASETASLEKQMCFGTDKNHLSWNQMKEMAASKLIRFESHTHSHNAAVDHIATLKEDVELSVQLLASNLGQQPQYFAYPFGARNSQTDQIVLSCGFKKLLTIENVYVRGKINEGRIDIHRGNEHMAQFKLVVAGISGGRIKHRLGLSG